MLAVYAIGSGLGHRTRVGLAVAQLGAALDPAGRSDDPAPVVLSGRPEDVPDPLGALAATGATALLVDTFPAGFSGELTATAVREALGPDAHLTHLARLLRWDAYRLRVGGDPLCFDVVHRVEPLAPAHDRWLHQQSAAVLDLDLGADATRRAAVTDTEVADAVAARARFGRSCWAVVHSGPPVEVAILVDEARALIRASGSDGQGGGAVDLVVLTLADTASVLAGLDVPILTGLRPSAMAPLVDGLVTAAGFNTLRELAPWRDRHHVVPFARRYDDQFARARRYSASEPPR